MNKKTNKVIICMLFLLAAVMFLLNVKNVQAATVTKVSGTVKCYKGSGSGYDYKQYTLLSGKASSGKIVWTYRTKVCPAVGGQSATWTVKGSSVYIIDDKTFVRLSKQTGKVLVKKKRKHLYGWMGVIAVDNGGNSYSIGKYAPYVVKLNKNGKVKWKCNVNKYPSYGFADKASLSANRLTIRFTDGMRLVINTGNGKIIMCKK